MKNNRLLLLLILLAAGCRKDPKTPIAEQELITTLRLTLTDTAAPYEVHTFSFTDIDGDGGTPAILDTVNLKTGKVYHAQLLLLDERNYPADTTTNEIIELSTEHQFFYQSVPNTLLHDFSYLDADTNGKPLGNEFLFKTDNTAATGILRITLRHQPNKDAPGVAIGNITNAAGETDIEVEFPLQLN